MDMIRKEAEVDSRALFCSLEFIWSCGGLQIEFLGEGAGSLTIIA